MSSSGNPKPFLIVDDITGSAPPDPETVRKYMARPAHRQAVWSSPWIDGDPVFEFLPPAWFRRYPRWAWHTAGLVLGIVIGWALRGLF